MIYASLLLEGRNDHPRLLVERLIRPMGVNLGQFVSDSVVLPGEHCVKHRQNSLEV